ncbi:MAG: hypothetical protein CMB62_02380 [Euryarchaeota archaeon]|nr:hypothetical protein [Euryarchaeota archaeon]
MFLSIGCIDIPAMNGLMDRIVPEKEKTYSSFEVWSIEGDFAPDPEQDQESINEAIADILEDPLQFQKPLQNLSWEINEHAFYIESEWEAKYVELTLSVVYELVGGNQLDEGPAGTLDFSLIDPTGGEHGEGYEIVTWNNPVDERLLVLPPIYGEWRIKISGSGFDGAGGLIYSGKYDIKVESEQLN